MRRARVSISSRSRCLTLRSRWPKRWRPVLFASETPGGSFALGHPEKLVDFGYRAVHEMTVTSKALIAVFYGRAAGFSYWNSCSNGGRQGLMEAQRFPADFDGIVAGSPAANWTG